MAEIKKAAIYARVSTQDQTVEQQLINCRRYCVAQAALCVLIVHQEIMRIIVKSSKQDL